MNLPIDVVSVMGKYYRRTRCAGRHHQGVAFTATEISQGRGPYCLCGELMEEYSPTPENLLLTEIESK